MSLMQYPLPYQSGTVWLQRLRHLAWPMLLESGRQTSGDDPLAMDEALALGARFDIVVADPFARLVTRGMQTTVWHDGQVHQYAEDPFELLKTWLAPYQTARVGEIPFAGGALGYFSYDLGRRIERLPETAIEDAPVPEMVVGLYDWAIVVDHQLQRCQLVSHGCVMTAAALEGLHAVLSADITTTESAMQSRPPFRCGEQIDYNFSRTTYAKAFDQVKSYIRAGDCYQINLAQRFSVPVQGDAWQAYERFRTLSQAPFMAFMQVDDGQGNTCEVLSMSPERFLQVRDGHVETRPIKGTRPRHADPMQDQAQAEALAASTKDRAENLMIVDLLRNDIGKVCQIGSVKVDALFKLQHFTNVHHLVSIVSGKLRTGVHALDVLRSCFPGGSITGAPKKRAMEIIEELEPHRRQVYCGSIGYIGFDGSMDTNIAIRTALVYAGRMHFYAGGGVVEDSDCGQEYEETLHKASQFFKLLSALDKYEA